MTGARVIAARRSLALGKISGRNSQTAGQKQRGRCSQEAAHALAQRRCASFHHESALQELPLRFHDLKLERLRLRSLSHVPCHHGVSEPWSFEGTGLRLRKVAGN